ncbi:trans-sulfuration enzyme family protein [Clostridium sp. Marseille-P299]|uniref:trans-sulfuration enzyme family protein n=1 Tax=Clostridium sp. Marseille-P299 TaxID=1805477 RepID=UPI00083364E0|nr:PLP-dependent aspartate aminotransferase family protein [Clostridium sp. Marseille-P299]
MKIETQCIHNKERRTDITGSLTMPIYQSATFAHPGVGMSTGYDYSRLQNPTREYLEKILANLEHAVDAIALSSGMAAISVTMELFHPGDHIIISNDLYGGSYRLFEHISEKNGIEFTTVNTSNIDDIKNAIKVNTKSVFLETVSNPMMQVTDLIEVSKLTKEKNLLLIVDNTFLSPYFQNPIDLGADIVIHSGTKYLCGHNDIVAGIIAVATNELSDKIRFIYKTTGACLSAMDSWLLTRSIKTLGIRIERQEKNAKELAAWLKKQPWVTKIWYVGLPDHVGYDIIKKQARGFGAMISIETDSKETALRILSNVNLIYYAESLGSVESLITYPMLQTHADLPEEERNAKGITDRFLRISVGIENVEDLIEDLDQAANGGTYEKI